MSTTLTPASTSPTVGTGADLGADQWVRIPATWGAYKRLLKARGERNHPRLIFTDGRLTVVSPSTPHEVYKKRLATLIEELFTELGLDFHMTGSVTLLRTVQPRRTGAEADESYYLTNIEAVRGKKDLVMGQDPPPDLVVEVVVSHPEGDALRAYAEFGIREVWVFKASGLEFRRLGAEGAYSVVPTSGLLPGLASEELNPWIFRHDFASDRQWKQAFRAWVAGTLAPRLQAGG